MKAVHGALFLAALVAGCLVPALGVWPLYLLVPILAYLALVACVPPLRRSFAGLPCGRFSAVTAAASLVVIVVASAVLIGFQFTVAPDLRPLAQRLPFVTWSSLVLAACCFSIGNAVLEEVAFRGILFDALAGEWNAAVAVVVTALVFGFLHQAGYPPGSLGAVLAGLYGLALGVLRAWTGGLLVPMFCHVFADATIFGILVSTGTLGSR